MPSRSAPLKSPGFKACMVMMQSRDPVTAEDDFQFLDDHAAEHLEELVAEFHKDDNSNLRYWLFEIIVEARDP